ncbi:MAG: DUF5106 domain-containing protein [Bacteroidia bacterium]|nr:DUF5106 domain-containing protein [Bacteroidia bacterium]
MKQFNIFMLGWAVLGLLMSCGKAGNANITSTPQKEGFEIKVEVKGTTANEAYLAYYYGDKQYIKDTTAIENGVFTFKGDTSLDGGIYLVVFPPKNVYFEIIIDKDQYFTVSTDTVNFVTNMKVSGSKENQLFYQDLKFLDSKRKEVEGITAELKKAPKGSPEAKSLQEKQQKINDEVKTYREKFIDDNKQYLFTKVLVAMQDPEIPEAPKDENGKQLDSMFAFKFYKAHYFDGMDFQDDRLLRTPVFQQRINTYIDRLTYRVPDSIIKSVDYMIEKSRGNDKVFRYLVVFFLNKYAQNKIMGMDAVYVHMVEKYYMTGDAYWVDDSTKQKMITRATALSPTILGRPAPDFIVSDSKGKYQKLSEVPGKWKILYFWDYGCGHCKKVTPKLSSAYTKYGFAGKDITLFTVNINGDVAEWKEKLQTYGLDVEGAINTEDIYRRSGGTKMYDVISTPRIYLIDSNGLLKAKQIGVPQLLKILSIEEGFDVDEEDLEEIKFDDIEE